MTKQELLNFVEAHQSEIGAFTIMPGRKFGGQFTLGYYFDEESQKYKFYEVSERQDFKIRAEFNTESEAIDRLYRKIVFRFNLTAPSIYINMESIDSIEIIEASV
ncbi:hypothetical protein [Streptococcus iners]|uniref:Uncharacterized protein n=1 Tax=Streptococcus iners TaxID=3028084 RepID=A0AA96VKN7_9STRE|nr:hypothetical protein [Streptococcus sp. 29887]WNY50161.1 hypothetical protein PW252_06110 [Streptococcus sp. 29887]